MRDREQMIEEAARAMLIVDYPGARWDETIFSVKNDWLNMARAALAVFEQSSAPADRNVSDLGETDISPVEMSSTPTDQDERKALAEFIDCRYDDYEPVFNREGEAVSSNLADDLIAAGWRRTLVEHPEPPSEPVPSDISSYNRVCAERDAAEAKLARIADLHGGWDTETNEPTQADLVQKTLDIIYVDKEADRG